MFAVLAALQTINHQRVLAVVFVAFAIWQSAVALVLRRRIARLSAAVGQRAAAPG